MTQGQEQFFTRLNKLDSGERAALKRQAGIMLREADARSVTAFYGCLPPYVEERLESRWYAVACLRCLWDAGEESGKPFEGIVAKLCKDEMISDSTKHRVQILLDTKWDDDGYMLAKLTRLVKLIRQKSDRVQPDFAALLKDLEYWNSESQYVQRRWARTVFSETNTDESDEEMLKEK